MDRFTHYEWPFLEPRHAALAREAEAWASRLEGAHDEDPSAPPGAEVDHTCRRLVRELGEAGYLKHCAPGGDAFDVRAIALLREVFAYHAGLADFSFVMQGLGSGPIALAGTEAQRKTWLPKVAAGEAIAAFGLSEPDAGSDVAALSTTARLDGDHWVLNGTKTWISNAGIADLYVIFAKTEDAPGTRSISAFIVDANTRGLDVRERVAIVAPHPMALVRMTDCRIPADSLLGRRGEGFKLAMRNLDVFRTTVGAAALGFARRALDEATGRAKTRKMFGQTLADFQMTQAKLADMATGIEAAALLTYRAAWVRDTQGRRVTREAAMSKMFATETAQEVVDAAVQILGGLGVARGHPVERLYREVRALRIYEGATEVQKLIIARELLTAAP